MATGVTRLPPGFRVVATSEGAPFAAIADDKRRFYGVQFHLEVVHTPHGARFAPQFHAWRGWADRIVDDGGGSGRRRSRGFGRRSAAGG